MLCSSDSSGIRLATDAIAAGFTEPYYKGSIQESQIYVISLGAQIKPVKIKYINTNNNTIEIIPDKPFVYFSGSIMLC